MSEIILRQVTKFYVCKKMMVKIILALLLMCIFM